MVRKVQYHATPDDDLTVMTDVDDFSDVFHVSALASSLEVASRCEIFRNLESSTPAMSLNRRKEDRKNPKKGTHVNAHRCFVLYPYDAILCYPRNWTTKIV